jgi:16S rRNA (cytosine967-C5)-methyltransferase
LLRDAWAIAIEALRWIETRKFSERLALAAVSKQLGIRDSGSIGLAHKLILETVRRQNLIDYILNSTLRPVDIASFSASLRAFLRLYTYQVQFEGYNTYEKAAKLAGIGRSILGWQQVRVAEEFLGLLLRANRKELLGNLSDPEKTALIKFQPVWFVKYCFKLLGRSQAMLYFNSTLANLPIYIRINTLRDEEDALLSRLNRENLILERVDGLKYTYRLVSREIPLLRTPSFGEGLFYIQDKASCLAAEVADPQAGMVVLDVCCAPGAKTTYLAQQMENQGEIFSVDYSQRRIAVWKKATQRMGVEIAQPVIADACNPLPFANLEADLVVVDPPCTSTGAFSRVPSAKWRLSKRSISRMAKIQWQMITNCVDYLKEGGSLVYSTCSITLEENEILIERFLKLRPEFALIESSPRIGASGLRGQTDSQRLYPHLHECNGFFVAKLVKRD